MKNIWKFLVYRITHSYFLSNFSLYLKGTFDILHSEVYTDRKYVVKILNFFSTGIPCLCIYHIGKEIHYS